MSWSEIAIVLFVSHAVGDYLLQTDWQATHKRGGLGHDSVARHALFAHVCTYTAAYIPALIWLSTELGYWTMLIAVLISVPHLIQDDRRLLDGYIRVVKHGDPRASATIAQVVDQTFHMTALFFVALLASALA